MATPPLTPGYRRRNGCFGLDRSTTFADARLQYCNRYTFEQTGSAAGALRWSPHHLPLIS
jgi:hypothetical protein